MHHLFFDTETTGFPKYNLPYNHPEQAKIVELAALLTDDTGKELSSMSVIINHDIVINDEVAKLHGITTELAEKVGVKPRIAFDMFFDLLEKAESFVAHNVQFDEFLVKCGATVLEADLTYAAHITKFDMRKRFCTMKMSQPICQLPPTEKMAMAGINGWKVPKLQEAYKHFHGVEFDNAHNALADVTACKDVFFKLLENKKAVA